jgi:hypothetical protein
MATTVNNAGPVAPAPPAGGAYPSDEDILGISDNAEVADEHSSFGRVRAQAAAAGDDRVAHGAASAGRVAQVSASAAADDRPEAFPSQNKSLRSSDENHRGDLSYKNNAAPDNGATAHMPEWLARASAAAPNDAPQFAALWQRATALETFDRAYYGADAAAQQQLITQLHADDPAVFRAMVTAATQVLDSNRDNRRGNAPPLNTGTGYTNGAGQEPGGTKPGAPEHANVSPQFDTAAYAQFEQATNDAVVADVGRAIERALDRALPSGIADGARRRIAGDTLAEVHAALRGDRQLAEQVAEILGGPQAANGAAGRASSSTARLDAAARDAVTRLITSRARGVVPEAARRVIGEWTGSVLATHRERNARQEAAGSRVDVTGGAMPEPIVKRAVAPGDINYRATSDEDILSW